MGQHRLTKTKIDSAKPLAKPCKLSDGGGLSLLITPTNSRLWRLRNRQPGLTRVDDGVNRGRRESMVSLGPYPDVSPASAREKAAKYREGLHADEQVTPADAKLTALEILECLRRLEARGKRETAHRMQQRVSQVIR